MKRNVILIGMSGAGKSTLGVLLAKALGKSFIDTDILIQQKSGKLLQEIIDTDGVDRFLELEEEILTSLSVRDTVIATGGSAVYSEKAMQALRQNGTVVYLRVDFEELARRVTNITTRGIVFKGNGDLLSVYRERLPLYEAYADVTLDSTRQGIEESVEMLVNSLTH